jgi:hypothetical protein
VYRIHDSSGVHADPGPAGAATQRVYQKWQNLWEPAQLQGIMQRVWSHQELEVHHHSLRGEREELRRALAQSVLSNERLSASYEQQLQLLNRQVQEIRVLSETIAAQSELIEPLRLTVTTQRQDLSNLLNSRSWRVTRPLRWLTDLFRNHVLRKPVGRAGQH